MQNLANRRREIEEFVFCGQIQAIDKTRLEDGPFQHGTLGPLKPYSLELAVAIKKKLRKDVDKKIRGHVIENPVGQQELYGKFGYDLQLTKFAFPIGMGFDADGDPVLFQILRWMDFRPDLYGRTVLELRIVFHILYTECGNSTI